MILIIFLWNFIFMNLSFYDGLITEMSKANRSITTNNVKSIYVGASLHAPTILWNYLFIKKTILYGRPLLYGRKYIFAPTFYERPFYD